MNKFLLFFTAFLIFCFFRTEFAQQGKPETCTGGVVNSKTTFFPEPEYPEEAKEKNISGSVSVRVSIDEEGNVTEAKACSGHLLLRPEAEKAALKAKFKQTKLSGILVKVSGVLVYKFDLNDEKAVWGGIINEKAVSLPAPDYPKEAENACAGGKVEVEVVIGEDGNVISAKAISGDELLQKPAIEAAKKAKFRTHSHFANVKVQGIIVYNFEPKIKCLTVGIVNKKAKTLPEPNAVNIIHPIHLQIKKEEIVAVQIVVDISGNVVYAKTLSGHPLLRAVCESSARQTKFAPLTYTGPPVKVKALLAYKFKPDGTVETDIERDDKDVIGTPIELVKPEPPFCNCRFGSENISVEAKIDAQGNVTEAKAANGHPILKNISEKAALESKFLPANIRAKIIIVYEFEAINDNREVKILNVYIEKVEIEKPLIVDHMPLNSKPLFMPEPEYSAAAKAVGAKGEVTIEILIDETGNVEEAKAVSGHPLLRNSAEKAAKLAKFKPVTLSGTPVKVRGFLVYNFN